MCTEEPGFVTLSVPVREPLVLLCWGDESLTEVHDDLRHGLSDHGSELQRQLMAVRLRHIADLLDPSRAATATRMMSGGT